MPRVPSGGSLSAARLALLCAVVASFAATIPVRADAVATVVPTDGLRLRAGPSTDERILDLIPGGARVAITGSPTGGWYPAAYRGQRGWVLGSHLAFDDASATARRATVVPADGLNLRRTPGEAAEVVTTLPLGAAVTAAGRPTSDGWVLVLAGDLSGWVSAAYLAFDGAPSSSPMADAPAVAGSVAGTTRVTLTWYNPSFEGSRMYCGGVYRADDPTIAATNSWPCGTVLRVCSGAACITVTVRDRGGMGANHIDLSAAGFARLASISEMTTTGTAEVVP